MKRKLRRIAITAVVITAAVWSTLWFAGRGKIEERLDAEQALLAQQGYTISHEGREVSGFPLGYAVTYRDLRMELPGLSGQAGAAYVLPQLTADISAADVERITARFPEKFYLEVPVDAATRASNPSLPERFKVEFESANMTAALAGLMSAERQITLAADSVLMVTAGPTQDINVAVEAIGVQMGTTVLPLDNTGMAPSHVLIDRLEYAIAATEDAKKPVVLQGSVDAVRMTGSSDIRRPGFAAEALFAGKGTSKAAYQTGASEGTLKVPEGSGDWSGTVTFKSGSGAGTVAVENGAMRWDSASQANRFTLGTADGAPGPSVEMRAIEFGYAMPFAPSEQMAPLLFRLALDQVMPDDALWSLIDAGGTLPRDPARLIIETEGEARMTQRLDQFQPGAAPPFELGAMMVKAADLTALGAALTTRGNLELRQPLMQPVGKFTITLKNATELLGKLAAAGIIDEFTARAGAMMADTYTVPGAAEGERISEVVLGVDGIKVNGRRIGGP